MPNIWQTPISSTPDSKPDRYSGRGDVGVTARSPTHLLDQVRDRFRVRHYSLRTEQAYLSWIQRLILASGSLSQPTAYRWASLGRRNP
ncbi:integrase [Xanthomonas citri pv. eucalyptorum]|nr:integrase [Xanthomonas axonopodis pv. eucalyptorum]